MKETGYTGERRYRLQSRLFQKPVLVLQVEVKGFVYEYAGGSVQSQEARWWRDATVEDLPGLIRLVLP